MGEKKYKYAVVKDSKGNHNIWMILGITKTDKFETVIVQSRNTLSYLEKEHCYEKEGSDILYCDENKTVDIAYPISGLDTCISKSQCIKCIYSNNCPDIYKIEDCEYFYDYDDEVLEIETEKYKRQLSDYDFDETEEDDVFEDEIYNMAGD